MVLTVEQLLDVWSLSPSKRTEVAHLLAATGDLKYIGPLAHLLGDADSTVRATAEGALSELGWHAGHRVLSRISESRDAFCAAALRVVLRVAAHDPQFLQAADEALSRLGFKDSDTRAALASLDALSRLRLSLEVRELARLTNWQKPRLFGGDDLSEIVRELGQHGDLEACQVLCQHLLSEPGCGAGVVSALEALLPKVAEQVDERVLITLSQLRDVTGWTEREQSWSEYSASTPEWALPDSSEWHSMDPPLKPELVKLDCTRVIHLAEQELARRRKEVP